MRRQCLQVVFLLLQDSIHLPGLIHRCEIHGLEAYAVSLVASVEPIRIDTHPELNIYIARPGSECHVRLSLEGRRADDLSF